MYLSISGSEPQDLNINESRKLGTDIKMVTLDYVVCRATLIQKFSMAVIFYEQFSLGKDKKKIFSELNFIEFLLTRSRGPNPLPMSCFNNCVLRNMCSVSLYKFCKEITMEQLIRVPGVA